MIDTIASFLYGFLEMFQYTFWRRAIYTGILASILFGIVGTYVVIKRIVFISDGIAHASFGGIGLAIFVSYYFFTLDPLLGAAIFALLSAVGIGIMSKEKVQREDTAIGIIWVMGMAVGALFYRITPGYKPSMDSFLFGNIYMIGSTDIYLLVFLVIGVLITVVLFYYELQAVSFDDEFAKIAGLNTDAIYIFLLILVALSIVFLLRFVGIILVIAMLTIPASISSGISNDIKKIMFYSCILSLVFVLCGLSLSYVFNTPAGPSITLFAGGVFVIDMIKKKVKT